MGTPSRHEGDLHINGHLTMKTGALPAGTLTDAMVNASAALGVEKMEHQYEKSWSNESATEITAVSQPLHIVHGTTGEVIAFDITFFDEKLLRQRVADAHHDAALDLALDGYGVHRPADVVGGDHV